jgi:hypothetical protein
MIFETEPNARSVKSDGASDPIFPRKFLHHFLNAKILRSAAPTNFFSEKLSLILRHVVWVGVPLGRSNRWNFAGDKI